jgi:tetraacyldisaccharide 4'-kinase
MSPVRRFPWLPVNALYGAGTSVRRTLYRSGVFSTQWAPVPVISVGNISAGGTGKTPLVAWLAESLAEAQTRICVISRGYGRPDPQARLLVSDGQKVLANADQAGDEPALLAESLLGQAAVLCDQDRAAGARWAVENLDVNLIILDDGFQHFRLGRVMDLVAVDASRPFAGLMREGRGALRRSDAVVLTRSDLSANLPGLTKQINAMGRPVFTAELQTIRVRPLLVGVVPAETAPLRAGAFCGIGNPDAFFRQVEREGFELVYRSEMRDHAKYGQVVLDEITHAARAAGAECLITTAKDEVKLRELRFDLPVYVLETALVIDNEAGLIALVRGKIKAQK